MGITRRNKQAGQGMTEYIIIVALIAIAAIGVYSLFGQTIRGQTGQMASEMGGQAGTGARDAAKSAGQEGASPERTAARTNSAPTAASRSKQPG